MSISSASLPSNMLEVQNVIQSASSIKNKSSDKTSDFFESSIARLEGIKGAVLAREQEFYRMIGCSEDNVDAGLRMFQDRLTKALVGSGAMALINVPESHLGQVAQNISEGRIIQSFESVFNANVDYRKPFGKYLVQHYGKEARKLSTSEVIAALRTVAKNQNGKNKGKNDLHMFMDIQGDGENKRSEGLQRYIGGFYWDPSKPKEQRLQVQFTGEFPQGYANIFEKDFGVKFPDLLNDNSIIENVKQVVNQKLTDSTIKNYVLRELETRSDQYSVNTSLASIKGFLGEITMNAVLHSLTMIYPKATGAIRKICEQGKGQEIPIDIIIETVFGMYGFQIKNYSEVGGKIRMGHRKVEDSMGLGNFIINRAQPEEGIQNILLALYGSYAYNTIFEEGSARSIFGETRAQLETVAKSFDGNGFFDYYIDNILKISDEFSANDEAFAQRQVYYNTFFLVNQRVVPSSRILQALINELKKETKDELITSSFVMTLNTAEDDYEPSDKEKGSALPYANLSSMHYNITLNVGKIVNVALNNAK